MLQQWRDHGATICAGYIIGFPGDTKASILRDIEIVKRELPLDVLEFFYLTPLPGSEDHKNMWLQGERMDPDLNRYDTHHRVSTHAVMSDEEWEAAYHAAWQSFYSPEHIRTILRRVAANPRGRPGTTLTTLLWFKLVSSVEGLHPLDGGAFRLISRRDRRPGLPREAWLAFYPRLALLTMRKAWRYLSVWREARRMLKQVLTAPDRATYRDLAISPPEADEYETLDLYQATSGGQAALARARRHRQAPMPAGRAATSSAAATAQ
jgi:hypothetical protein